ncbi:MAG: hypothetical protein ACOY8P_07280 [Thermodesulfobacteriota bacterium]
MQKAPAREEGHYQFLPSGPDHGAPLISSCFSRPWRITIATDATDGRRGGQVFNCLHSFTEAGCGKDVHCEICTIKNAIVDTFTTANPHHGVAAGPPVKEAGRTTTYVVQVSTEKLGDFALVRIERHAAGA